MLLSTTILWTKQDNNSTLLYENITNEWYAKDASRKVKSAYRTKALNGEFTGPYAPYGYKKSEENKHKLVPDENTSWVVHKIFKLASEGISPFRISTILKNEKILKTRAYIMDAHGKYVCHSNVKYPYDWSNQTIINILQSQVYLGHMVNNKHTTKSFKCKKIVEVAEENWIIVKNTHEPLVDEKTFAIAGKVAKVKRRLQEERPERIFSGLLKCGDCGKAMSYQSRDGRTDSASYACNVYRRHGKEYCSMHYITHEQLYDIVLKDIRNHIYQSQINEEMYVEWLSKIVGIKTDKENTMRTEELTKAQRRVLELDAIIQKMYEDNVLGKISDERYMTLSETYEAEQKTLKERIDILQTRKIEFNEKNDNMNMFIENILRYTDITVLDAEVLNALISKIVVHECEYINGKRTQKVDIHYRYVGALID